MEERRETSENRLLTLYDDFPKTGKTNISVQAKLSIGLRTFGGPPQCYIDQQLRPADRVTTQRSRAIASDETAGCLEHPWLLSPGGN